MSKRIAIVAALVGLAFPAAAGAKIVVNRGMFAVNLGATKQQVRRELGQPSLVRNSGGETQWIYLRRKLVLQFRAKGQRLHLLYTESRAERTPLGIGVGSSKRAVTHAYPGVLCRKGPSQSIQDCIVFSPDMTRLTDFRIGANGRVHDIGILAAPF